MTMLIGTARSIGALTAPHRRRAPLRKTTVSPTPSIPRSRPFTHAVPSMWPTPLFEIAFAAGRPAIRTRSPPSSPAIGLASLSGQTEGFDYTGSSGSLSTGAELGAGSWQTGLVASFTHTDLDYRAGAEPLRTRLSRRRTQHRNPFRASLRCMARFHRAGTSGRLLGAGLGAPAPPRRPWLPLLVALRREPSRV